MGVLAGTARHMFVLREPEATLTRLFGGIAPVANMPAAVVLLPHRDSDTNVRAVWLFSPNDAIGILAIVIAELFLQSASAIGRDAWADLRADAEAPSTA